MTTLWLALAGGGGAGLRYGTDIGVRRQLRSDLPVGTLIVNIAGSFLLGVLTGAVVFHGVTTRLTTIAGTGFCGGYTTFSAASVEAVVAAEGRRSIRGLTVAAANLVGSIAAASLGFVLLYAA
jgi:CrcB protein